VNRETNKRGKGRPLKIGRGRKYLGIITYIQEIIARAESEKSSRGDVRLRFQMGYRPQTVPKPYPFSIA